MHIATLIHTFFLVTCLQPVAMCVELAKYVAKPMYLMNVCYYYWQITISFLATYCNVTK